MAADGGGQRAGRGGRALDTGCRTAGVLDLAAPVVAGEHGEVLAALVDEVVLVADSSDVDSSLAARLAHGGAPGARAHEGMDPTHHPHRGTARSDRGRGSDGRQAERGGAAWGRGDGRQYAERPRSTGSATRPRAQAAPTMNSESDHDPEERHGAIRSGDPRDAEGSDRRARRGDDRVGDRRDRRRGRGPGHRRRLAAAAVSHLQRRTEDDGQQADAEQRRSESSSHRSRIPTCRAPEPVDRRSRTVDLARRPNDEAASPSSSRPIPARAAPGSRPCPLHAERAAGFVRRGRGRRGRGGDGARCGGGRRRGTRWRDGR